MKALILLATALQAGLLALLAIRLRQRCLGAIGFLLAAATFVYHGLTEVAQAIFPDRDLYRDMTTDSWVASWTLLITAALALFIAAYLLRLKKKPLRLHIDSLIANLDRAYLLNWPVLLALGLPSFLMILLRKQEDTGGYWSSGLAFQFTPLILTLSFATMCIKTHGRGFLLILMGFSVLLIAWGSRFEVLATALLAMSAMVRYGVRFPRGTLIAAGATLLACFVAISASRGVYGRFTSGESFGVRLGAIAATIASPETVSSSELLDDSIYRFDGNSFGALVLEKQADGYGITGVTQAKATVGYMIPSFLYPDKLKLDDYLRNEEGYVVEFYGLPSIDYMSDFWTLLLCYVGPWGFLVCAGCLGWLCAALDNWLSGTANVVPYVIGLGISGIPVNLEQGLLANILDTMRTLAVLGPLVWMLTRRKQPSRLPGAVSSGPPIHLPQHT